MKYQISWSPLSRNEYAEILKRIEKEFGKNAVLKFMDKTDAVISAISKFPKSGGISKKGQVRKFVISEQTSVIYNINKQVVEILFFWDTRQNPKKIDGKL